MTLLSYGYWSLIESPSLALPLLGSPVQSTSNLGTARFNAFFPSNSSIGDGKGYQSLLKRMLVRAMLHKPEMLGLESDVINSKFIA